MLGEVHCSNESEKEEIYDYNDNDDEEDDSEKPKLSLLWMTKRMRRIVNMELGQSPTSRVLVIINP